MNFCKSRQIQETVENCKRLFSGNNTMAYKHMKTCSTSIGIREMQIKTKKDIPLYTHHVYKSYSQIVPNRNNNIGNENLCVLLVKA